MRKLFLTAVLVICFATYAAAQNPDGYHRFEVFKGYSYFMLERPEPIGDGTRLEGFHGITTAATLNVKRYFGLKFDFARYSKRYDLCEPGEPDPSDLTPDCFTLTPLPGSVIATDDPHRRTSIYNFMGGVQLKDTGRTEKVLRPFAHLTIGSTLTRERAESYSPAPASGQLLLDFDTRSEWGPAGAIGGGLDIKMTERIDIRAIQFDYHKATIFARSTDNLRFGVGLVFR
jgi:hypothetical protein